MVGVERTTDTPAESTEKPPAPEQPYTPPPDRPGSLGQPSRLESRAAARTPPESGAEDEQGTDENVGAPGDGRGRKAEEESDSPAPEETEQDKFADLPTRADLDPPSAGALTRERGELTPVNEDQDLSEPEDGDRVSRLLRRVRDNPDDAEDNLDRLLSNMDKALERPPSGSPVSAQDTGGRGDSLHGGSQQDVQGASAFVGAAVLAILAKKAADRIRDHGGRDDGGHR